ncbi:DUF5126 domain-containing protein [Sphingobacterium sp. SGG-5]|uniref:DUF5000 domain-containing lipoprotein n=1 Tax=Sphingobacterium sp. SGG-5 TaxID=2710881 RepID=UPI0013EAC7AF|nr:DUF5000 domain-containing lipoprotein [Sphingobacterium sp. SGG-5]NGM62633.1 DUF5126 domain-containing protein [Sphingobacterium sp. SGG-5]
MKRRILFFFTILLFVGCKESQHTPMVHDGSVPGSLSNIKVENMPGAAKISYTLPDDPNVLYVQAEYSLLSGETKVVKSSVSKNYVLLEGFYSTTERPVKLFAVSRSEVPSDAPSVITIKPLTSPIENARATLEVFETFGGLGLKFLNETQASYIIYTLYKDTETGNWIEHDRFYVSDAREVKFAVRGLAAETKDFGIYFVDKWKNHSDTLFRTLTPLYEEEMDKSLFANAMLFDDYYTPRYAAYPLSMLWTPGGTTYFLMQPAPELTLPNWFTIDLGRAYKFGRMRVNQLSHSDTWQFASGSPRVFEIWGSNVKSTNWDDWTLMGTFESIKPSGEPLGTLTADDRALNARGEDFDFEPMDESFRYVRFKTKETWGGNPDVTLLELTFWGQIAN